MRDCRGALVVCLRRLDRPANLPQLETLLPRWHREPVLNLTNCFLAGAYLFKESQQTPLKTVTEREDGFEGVQLQGAFLTGAQLHGAFVLRGQLQNANLSQVQAQGAYFVGAQLQNADIEALQLDRADIGIAQDSSHPWVSRLQKSHFWAFALQGLEEKGACFSGTNWQKAHLSPKGTQSGEKMREWFETNFSS